MTSIVAFVSQKGGVGKSTLSEPLHEKRQRPASM